jgi:hypothetical protein
MSIKARSTAATRSDRRSQKRQTMVLRVGLLEAGSRTAFCLVKNISPEGVQVKLYGSLLPDCDVSLKVGDENPLRGRLVWVRDGFGGIQFEKPLQLKTLLRVTQKLASTNRRSSPRVNAASRAILRTRGHTFSAELCDISATGAKIRTKRPIAPGPSALLTLPGMPTLKAHVRWAEDDEMGLFFESPIPIQIIAGWLDEGVPLSS